MPSLKHLALAVTVLALLQYVYWQLTTGAQRRRMIRENGCEPVVRYENKGILGKLFGLDVIQATLSSAKQGRMCQQLRIRNYTGRNTVMHRLMFKDGEYLAMLDCTNWEKPSADLAS